MKINLKYYFLSIFCGLIFISLSLTSAKDSNYRDNKLNRIIIEQNNNFNLLNYNSNSVSFNYFIEISNLDLKIAIPRLRPQNKIQHFRSHEVSFLTIKYSNTSKVPISTPKILDKSNHCCFLI